MTLSSDDKYEALKNYWLVKAQCEAYKAALEALKEAVVYGDTNADVVEAAVVAIRVLNK